MNAIFSSWPEHLNIHQLNAAKNLKSVEWKQAFIELPWYTQTNDI